MTLPNVIPNARVSILAVAMVASLVLAACGQGNQYVAPPPPKVTVATPVQRPVTRYLELTGSTAAVNSADLVARIPGFVQDISYSDGALVKKGTLLFTIEPEPYEVKLQQAQAAEAGAQATLKQAQSDFDRQARLVTTQAASQSTYDQALATRDTAQSNFLQAQASTKLAALNNDYAHVLAPFDGLVAARQVSVGEFVGGATTPTKLATIVQADPIYVNFNVSEQDVLRLAGRLSRAAASPATISRRFRSRSACRPRPAIRTRHLWITPPPRRSVDRHAGGTGGAGESRAGSAAGLLRPRARPGGAAVERVAGARCGARQ